VASAEKRRKNFQDTKKEKLQVERGDETQTVKMWTLPLGKNEHHGSTGPQDT
jgi:hypothetical protein